MRSFQQQKLTLEDRPCGPLPKCTIHSGLPCNSINHREQFVGIFKADFVTIKNAEARKISIDFIMRGLVLMITFGTGIYLNGSRGVKLEKCSELQNGRLIQIKNVILYF